MTPRRHEVIVAASLHKIGGRSAIDLKIESQILPKVRSPQNNKTLTRLGGGSDRRYANKNENEKECGGGGVSWLHRRMLCSGFVFGECGVGRLLDSLSRLPLPSRGKALPPSQVATAPRGLSTPRMGGEKRNPNPTTQ
jgi:hypothetical protein